MEFGLDRLRDETQLQQQLAGRRVALLAHPASVDRHLVHALDVLSGISEIKLSAAFGPQHGLKGDKQDNMVESTDFTDSRLGIPVYSLYGSVRRLTDEMLDSFDVILIDLQDLGCRIYTFITTLLYVLEACAEKGKSVWILDRPNPIGRPVEGLCLVEGWESFVGAAPMPMRHGLTMGEMAAWFVHHFGLSVDLNVVEMRGWSPSLGPDYGWPAAERAWINPSPNAPNLHMARCYPGTVMLEGTHVSEARGTTRPLEMFGAPDIDADQVLAQMNTLGAEWLGGCVLRPCWFEPTFHKHQGALCAAIQIHVDESARYDHERFKPWRLIALFFKAIRQLNPEYLLWRDFHYEYEKDRLAIDLINGGTALREWVDDPVATVEDLEILTKQDEQRWEEQRAPFLLYE